MAIIPALDAAQLTRQLKSLHEELLARDKVSTFWGVSAPFDSPSQLSNANQEAKCAALAVGKLGTAQSPVVIHEHLGVLTLLLNGGGIAEGHDLRKYVDRMLGPMLKYDSAHHGVLAKTIRSYLDNDCSLKLTALQLFVHEKTVRYRLAQFEELTGVDLRRHRERMSVDLALLMHDFATRSAGVAGKGGLTTRGEVAVLRDGHKDGDTSPSGARVQLCATCHSLHPTRSCAAVIWAPMARAAPAASPRAMASSTAACSFHTSRANSRCCNTSPMDRRRCCQWACID